jgi:collagen type VI alpha
VFILDLSGSISDASQYDTILNFTKAVINGLPSQATVGVVTYDSVARNEFFLSTYGSSTRSQLLNAIAFNTPDRGTTSTQTALNLTLTSQFTAANGDQPNAPNYIILVSDGYSDVTEGSSSSANAAQQLKNNGVRIITVGLTDNPNLSELNNISSNPPNNTFSINSSQNIATVASNVLYALCFT